MKIQTEKRTQLSFLYSLVVIFIFCIFPMGPTLDGVWTTTGIRSIFPILFEAIVMAAFVTFYIFAKKTPKAVMPIFWPISGAFLVIISSILMDVDLRRPYIGDEQVYINMLTLDQSTAKNIDYRINTIPHHAFLFIALLCLGAVFLSLLIFKLVSNKFHIDYKVYFLMFTLILLRIAVQLFSGFNYQYPIGFGLPLFLTLLVKDDVLLTRLIWSLIMLTFLLVAVSKTQSQRKYMHFSIFIVCAFLILARLLKNFSVIEPAWLSIPIGYYVIQSVSSMKMPNLLFIAISIYVRPTNLIWLSIAMIYSLWFRKANERRNELKVVIIVMPVITNLLWTYLLDWNSKLEKPSNDPQLYRMVEQLKSIAGNFGFQISLAVLFLTILGFGWTNKNLMFRLVVIFLPILSWSFLVPEGAIGNSKYAYEVFFPFFLKELTNSPIVLATMIKNQSKKLFPEFLSMCKTKLRRM